MPTAVRSHSKINLGLAIGAPRPDGFHSLVTVYQTLELHDIVTVTARPAAETSLLLTSNDSRVPTDSRNTAWKMVALALEAAELSANVEIHIEKRLPVQGGLGAGSANAVAALVGLEAELGIGGLAFPPFAQKALEAWGPEHSWPDQAKTPRAPSFRLLSGERVGEHEPDPASVREQVPHNQETANWPARRFAIAPKVGSDVPLFLIGGTILGLDRGQQVEPLPDLDPTWCVIATPEVGVSTPQAFRDWDALCVRNGLTQEASAAKLEQLSRAYASAFGGLSLKDQQGTGSSGVLATGEDLAGPQESVLVRTGISRWIQNDFEQVVFPQHPSLAEIKRLLAAAGTPEAALHASLSGSGSALYGLYQTRGDAEAAQVRLVQAGVRSHLTRTLPRQAYWREMICRTWADFEH
jgi:4-diphosphocytidyl-2-C-methyl-D-erythritol kinase